MDDLIPKQNCTPLLKQFRCLAEVNKYSGGYYCWKLHFDTNDFLYTIENEHNFLDPIECNEHLELFCKKNEIIISKKEFN